MAETRARPQYPPQTAPRRSYRPWIALTAAALVFALIPLQILPQIYAVPVIGLILAFGAAPDHVPGARPLRRSPRNWVLGALVGASTAIVVFQPQLFRPLISLLGPTGFGLVVALATVAITQPIPKVSRRNIVSGRRAVNPRTP